LNLNRLSALGRQNLRHNFATPNNNGKQHNTTSNVHVTVHTYHGRYSGGKKKRKVTGTVEVAAEPASEVAPAVVTAPVASVVSRAVLPRLLARRNRPQHQQRQKKTTNDPLLTNCDAVVCKRETLPVAISSFSCCSSRILLFQNERISSALDAGTTSGLSDWKQ
jgi:hypothetical protein